MGEGGWKGTAETRHEVIFSLSGWHPSAPEEQNEVVFLSLFLTRADTTELPSFSYGDLPNFSYGTEQRME